jgi:histidinol dehydrogenase
VRIERIEWDGVDARALAKRIRSLAPAQDEVTGDVAEIVADVRERGDEALREVAERPGGSTPRRSPRRLGFSTPT